MDDQKPSLVLCYIIYNANQSVLETRIKSKLILQYTIFETALLKSILSLHCCTESLWNS